MNLVFLLICLILLFIIWKYTKPYFIRHDTTCLITGGLGAGKTLEGVKRVVILIRLQRIFKYYIHNYIVIKLRNFIVRQINRCRIRKGHQKELNGLRKNTYKYYNDYVLDKYEHTFIWRKKPFLMKLYRPKPMVYSNMPICFKPHFWSTKKKREWAEKLLPEHVLLLKKITEYSVCFIDEFPQFINQFNWNEPIVQKNVNEWITMYRHYIGGYLVITAQSEGDIVVQVRRKLNQAIWCYDFKKHLFGLFYTNRMCDIMLSDNISTMSTTQIDENTKLHFGLFPPRKTYDTRCYSIRYENIFKKANPREFHNNIKTFSILRLTEYVSPLDCKTTYAEKMSQLQLAYKLRNEEMKAEIK